MMILYFDFQKPWYKSCPYATASSLFPSLASPKVSLTYSAPAIALACVYLATRTMDVELPMPLQEVSGVSLISFGREVGDGTCRDVILLFFYV